MATVRGACDAAKKRRSTISHRSATKYAKTSEGHDIRTVLDLRTWPPFGEEAKDVAGRRIRKQNGTDKSRSHERLQVLTRQMSGFAAQRRLKDTIKTFDLLLAEGLTPSVQVYACLINAHVNSGDMSGATQTFSRMHAAGLRSNVVVCTALLKGFCRVGDIGAASFVVDDMCAQDPPVRPDLRLINTMLRGCVRVGNLKAARSVFDRLGAWQLEPDTAACRFMGSLFSNNLQPKAIGKLLRLLDSTLPPGGLYQDSSVVPGEAAPCRFWAKGKCTKGVACPFFHDSALARELSLRAEPERLDGVAALNLDQARAAALLGRRLSCRRALRRAEAALLAAQKLSNARAHGTSKELQGSNWREQQLDIELLHEFLATVCGGGSGFKLSHYLARCFLFSASTATAALVDQRETCNMLVQELTASWGLRRCKLASRKALAQRFLTYLQRDGRLRWDIVFPTWCNETGKRLPVKLELGAGNGEWVAAQAELDAGKANWAALELMRDRAHSIFRRVAFQGLQNVCVISGDANFVLPRHIADNSIAHIFVNFPEPPFVSGDEAAESNLHMLTEGTFLEMRRVLLKGGRVTILSDNERYLRSLARSVAGLLAHGHRPQFQSIPPDKLWPQDRGASAKHDDVEGVQLYHGWPGQESGHAVKASSYFDSLWQRSKRTGRFFLVLRAM